MRLCTYLSLTPPWRGEALESGRPSLFEETETEKKKEVEEKGKEKDTKIANWQF
jgi:hypothetical protein